MTPELDAALHELDDYVRGEGTDVAAYEEELFARALAGEAPELRFRSDLGRTLCEMRARGTIDVWLTARGVEKLDESGLRIAHFTLDPDQPGRPDLSADLDILVTKVPIDLRGVHRLEAEVMSPDGKRLKVMPDVAFDPADGAVFMCCEIELARAAAGVSSVTNVWAYDEAGQRRLLREIRMT
ncbi:MAG TPA: hypothetical protein VJR89_20965 [Polyangiales bacterium]|nr:hypothetical protein [Polyangiales bacterium]